MVGINKYDVKDKRKERRRNHITRDLLNPLYRQRVIPARKRKWLNSEDEVFFDDDEDST